MHDTCPRCGLFHPAGSPCLAATLPVAPVEGLVAGTLLAGRYRIIRIIHRGGMSTVYLAEDTLLHGRAVALKELRLPAEATAGELREAEAWFARESALLSSLRHPLIPAFYSVFREDDRSYIAQEYIEGDNLDELVRSHGPAEPDQVVAWGLALCGLLEYLHTQPEPVIFRDLKPANALLRASWSAPDRRLAVVDFGIARPYQQGSVGTVIGTPGYAPPEQYQGLATPQSDIYALGATLHRLLTGYDPEHGSPFTFPPIGDLNPSVSPLLADAVDRALAINPADRYDTAAEFGDALRALRLRPVHTSGTFQGRGAGRGRAGAWLVAAVLLFPLVISQVFRSTGSSYVYSTSPMQSTSPQRVAAMNAIGLPCVGSDMGGQPSTGITCGPDGAMWLIDPQAPTMIDRIDVNGAIRSYPVPSIFGALRSLSPGEDSCLCLWAAGSSGNALSVDVRDGSMTTFPVPVLATTLAAGTLGPNDTLWLAVTRPKNRIVRVSPDGSALVIDLPDGAAPTAITAVPDGSVWFTENKQLQGHSYGYIGSITPQGALKEWRIPTPGSSPRGIAEGLDENLWFTEENGNKIGRITSDGQLTEFALPTPGAQPIGIMAGSDGGLWFSEMRGDRIGHISVVDGSAPQFTEYFLPPGSHPFHLAIGPDGRVWWTGEPAGTGARVGALDLNGSVQIFDTSGAVHAISTMGAQGSGADSASP